MSNAQAQKKLFKKICRKVGVTLRDHAMIQPGDHILIGLSGGKDSMILLETLAERRSAVPFDFELSAAHISVENIPYTANIEEMKEVCKQWDVSFIQEKTEVDLEINPKKAPCFTCSWQRRKSLFELTKKLGCNKVALGHHRYDALETMMMNMIYHGSISSLPYTLSMFDGRIELIRPLLDMDENLLKEFTALRNYDTEGKTCEFEDRNKRDEMRDLLLKIEKLHGKGSFNMFKSMDKIYEEYLPKKRARTS